MFGEIVEHPAANFIIDDDTPIDFAKMQVLDDVVDGHHREARHLELLGQLVEAA